MSRWTNVEEEPKVLSTVSAFLTGIGQEPPLDSARQVILDEGFHFVGSAEWGNQQHALSEAVDLAEARKAEGKGEAGEFKLRAADPAPEAFIDDLVAAVFGVIERIAPDGSLQYQSFAVFTLVKLDEGSPWKLSGIAHAHPPPGTPLPAVEVSRQPSASSKTPAAALDPEIQRLLTFADVGFASAGKIDLEDWAVPGTRLVRHRVPAAPVGLTVQEALDGFSTEIPAGTTFHEDFEDIEVRIGGDTALVFMHFEVVLSGKRMSNGIDILALSRQKGHWRFSATQTLSKRIE